MTHDTPTPPFEIDTRLEADDTTTWTITAVTREYAIDIADDTDTDTDHNTRTVYYPEATLVEKLDRGELQLPDPEPDDEPEDTDETSGDDDDTADDTKPTT